MNKFVAFLMIGFLSLAVSVYADSNSKASSIENVDNIFNFYEATENVYGSGQPTQEQLTRLKEAGFKHIVNLRPESEQSWDEKAYVESLGMEYHHIPVKGMAGVTKEKAAILAAVLEKVSNDGDSESVLLHCASGGRVKALLALKNEADKQ